MQHFSRLLNNTLAHTDEATGQTYHQFQQEAALRTQQAIDKERLAHFESLIPKRYRQVSFADFQIDCEVQQKVVKNLKLYIASFKQRLAEGSNLFFLGRPGTGKTLLAYVVYREVLALGAEVIFNTLSTWLLNLRDNQHRFNEPRIADLIQRLTRPHLLILDEVSAIAQIKNFAMSQEKQALFEIINQRYEAVLSTLLIANADKATLQNLLGGPIMDRLNHSHLTLAFDWPSYRKNRLAE